MTAGLGVRLVGDSLDRVDGIERGYLSLDAAASTGALPGVASQIEAFERPQRCTCRSEPACSPGPEPPLRHGDPFLAGGGAFDLVDLDEVVWTDPPDREEAGSPNVLGAVALHTAIDELTGLAWDVIRAHDDDIARRLRDGFADIDGVGLLGPFRPTRWPASFVVHGMPHALVAARLSAEHAIGVRYGCFCAHPYLLRLLGCRPPRSPSTAPQSCAATAGRCPAPCGPAPGTPPPATTSTASFTPSPGSPAARRHRHLRRADHTGDYWPRTDNAAWSSAVRRLGVSCARG